MNKCPKCRNEIPNGKMLCLYCLAKQNEETVRRAQFIPLLTVASGRGEFTLHEKPTGDHLQLFGPSGFVPLTKEQEDDAKKDRCFCGEKANAVEKKQRRIAYRGSYMGRAWEQVCEKCRARVEELLAEARQMETEAAS